MYTRGDLSSVNSVEETYPISGEPMVESYRRRKLTLEDLRLLLLLGAHVFGAEGLWSSGGLVHGCKRAKSMLLSLGT